jgi:hypothetical protein
MRKSWRLFVFTGLLWTVACSPRPDRELVDARQALEAATTAEADLYCPDLYQNAADVLRAGESETAEQDRARTTRKNYRQAAELLIRARGEAELAARTAAVRRERAKSIANSRQSLAEMALQGARKKLASSANGRRVPGPSGDDLSNDLALASRLLEEARKAYSEGRYMDAAHQFEAVTLQSRVVGSRPGTHRRSYLDRR